MNKKTTFILLIILPIFAFSSSDSLFAQVTGIQINLNENIKELKESYKISILDVPHLQKQEYIEIVGLYKSKIFIEDEEGTLKRIDAIISGKRNVIEHYYKTIKSNYKNITGIDSLNYENENIVFFLSKKDTIINIMTYCKDSKYQKSMRELLENVTK